MKWLLRSVARAVPASTAIWLTGSALQRLHSNRSVAALVLVLEVLGVATIADWLLAVLASGAASLAFSYYFVDTLESFQITSTEGALTFSMMLLTALTGSHLAVRAQRRAEEAVRRREEMERLQQLGNVLLAADTLAEAADNVVRKVVELFGVSGALLRLGEEARVFRAGDESAAPGCVIGLELASDIGGETPVSGRNVLELRGPQPSAEVQYALANLINLVLDRARSAEERGRIEAAQRGEELRNTVLNALAHNFKTPLTSIKAAASMLRGSREIATASGRELVAVIDEEADRLDQLIRESLELARIESHRVNPRSEDCSLSEIAARVSRRVARYLGKRELLVEIPEDLPAIPGDSFLLEQMMMQVVDNAWKYSKPGAEIRIGAARAGRRVIVTVRNQGSQIPPDERARIFDKFYRGAATRSQVEGTGLGLAIAKAIAEAHGGYVWLDAEPAGPAFRFSLPVEKTGKRSDREPHLTSDRR